VPVPASIFSADIRDMDLRVVSGTWPSDISGEMFVSAPVVDHRLSSQLFGFGALLRLSLVTGTHGAPVGHLALRTRPIDTPVYRLHEKAREKFTGSKFGFASPFGYGNMANTAPLGWGGRLFATWDVGRPVEVDPLTLRFLGEVGSAQAWGGDAFNRKIALPQLFSTAHPVVDPERGCMWTVKLTFTADGSQPWLVRYDGHGAHVSMWPLDGARVYGSMHTISQTRNWLVLSDSGNYKTDLNEVRGGERTTTIDERVSIYFVRKDATEAVPAGQPLPFEHAAFGPTTGHYYANWDDSDGIRVLFEHMDLTDLGYRLRAEDVDAHGNRVNPAYAGFYQMAMRAQSESEIVFTPGAPEGRVVARFSDERSWNMQLSAMDWSPAGLHAPTHHHIACQGRKPSMLARRVLDIYRDRIDERDVSGEEQGGQLITLRRGDLAVHARYDFPSLGDLPSSPIFVPRQHDDYVAGGGDGYVIVPVLNDDGLRVECFDAADVSRGPVATARAPHGACLPFILHSNWMEDAAPAKSVERLRFADELTPAALARLSDDERALVLAVADELG